MMTLTYLNNISTIHVQEDNNFLTLCDMYVNKEFTKISVKNAKSRRKDWCIFCTDEIEELEKVTEKNKTKKLPEVDDWMKCKYCLSKEFIIVRYKWHDQFWCNHCLKRN